MSWRRWSGRAGYPCCFHETQCETIPRRGRELEHKRRKRDVLADESMPSSSFFDARIPVEVNSAKGLCKLDGWAGRTREKTTAARARCTDPRRTPARRHRTSFPTASGPAAINCRWNIISSPVMRRMASRITSTPRMAQYARCRTVAMAGSGPFARESDRSDPPIAQTSAPLPHPGACVFADAALEALQGRQSSAVARRAHDRIDAL